MKPRANPASRNASRDQRQADKKARGECVEWTCTAKAVAGRVRCQPCLDRVNAAHRGYAAERREARPPNECKGCKESFAPRTRDQLYCTSDCFLRSRKPWKARKVSVGTLRWNVLNAGLCACKDCMVGRAAAIARMEARKAGQAPVTKEQGIAAFAARVDAEREARKKARREGGEVAA